MIKFILATLLLFVSCFEANAAAVPEYFVVRGKLVNQKYAPQSGLFDIRISFWLDADANDENPESTENALWIEEQTIELNKDGRFEIEIGTVNQLPNNFNFDIFKYVQIDAKPALGNEFFILDPFEDTTIDRIHAVTVPFKARKTVFQDSEGGTNFDTEYYDTELSSLKTTLTALTHRVDGIDKSVTINKQDVDTLSQKMVATTDDIAAVRASISEVNQDLQSFVARKSIWGETIYATENLLELDDPRIGEVHFVANKKVFQFFDGEKWKPLQSEKEEAPKIQKAAHSHAEIVRIHQKASATPGVFYWDKTNKKYFVGMADGRLRTLFGENDANSANPKEDLPIAPQENWLDLRFKDFNKIAFEKTNSLDLQKDEKLGLKLRSNINGWNEAIALSDLVFDRQENKTFEFVFYSGDLEGRVMMGLADENIDVNELNDNGYQYPQIALFAQNRKYFNKMFGQKADGELWYEIFPKKVPWRENRFYKVSMTVGAKKGLSQNMKIDEVDPTNWSHIIQNIVDFKSENQSTARYLKPFFVINGPSDYRLVGLRIK
jgi:hypothetical protein